MIFNQHFLIACVLHHLKQLYTINTPSLSVVAYSPGACKHGSCVALHWSLACSVYTAVLTQIKLQRLPDTRMTPQEYGHVPCCLSVQETPKRLHGLEMSAEHKSRKWWAVNGWNIIFRWTIHLKKIKIIIDLFFTLLLAPKKVLTLIDCAEDMGLNSYNLAPTFQFENEMLINLINHFINLGPGSFESHE